MGIAPSAHAQRALGIDVSDWQGSLSLSNWQTIHKSTALGGGGKDFTFIRSSRGGTTGTYDEVAKTGTLSQRYDDLYFYQNIDRATSVGMLAGPYHFARPDIIATTAGANGIANTGTDEANHMLSISGPYMRPGYIRPVLDLESGNTQRTTAELSQFAVDFANRIFAVKGIYPMVYINSSYATDEVNSSVTIMDQWLARWPNQSNPDAINVQTGDPPAASGYPNVYGVWNPTYPTIPNPAPWKFWQYASTGHVPGIGGGTASVDLDVAHGDLEFVKDFLVPAMWTIDSGGQWTTLSNWNSGVADPSGHGGAARLPNANDRVIIDRPTASYLVQISSGTQSIRSLFNNERLSIAGGVLNVQQYVQLNGAATLSSGGLTAASLANAQAFTQSGGVASINGAVTGNGSLSLSGGSFNAASIKQDSITITGGVVSLSPGGAGGASVTKSLSISGPGKLDTADDDLIVDYTGSSPIASIRSALGSAYDNGAWDGPGLTSSAAAASASSNHKMAIGYAEASALFTSFPASFHGVSLDNTAVVLTYTASGDANLDGVVDTTDFDALAANFGASGKTWTQADFNYDGVTDTLDFNQLAANFGYTAPSSPALALVPEPALSCLLAATLALPLRCTRRLRRTQS